MSNKKADLEHPGNVSFQENYSELGFTIEIYLFFFGIVGYNAGEQHLGKSNAGSSGSDLPPQAGTHGQPGSHISGQKGPEILGGKFSILKFEK